MDTEPKDSIDLLEDPTGTHERLVRWATSAALALQSCTEALERVAHDDVTDADRRALVAAAAVLDPTLDELGHIRDGMLRGATRVAERLEALAAGG